MSCTTLLEVEVSETVSEEAAVNVFAGRELASSRRPVTSAGATPFEVRREKASTAIESQRRLIPQVSQVLLCAAFRRLDLSQGLFEANYFAIERLMVPLTSTEREALEAWLEREQVEANVASTPYNTQLAPAIRPASLETPGQHKAAASAMLHSTFFGNAPAPLSNASMARSASPAPE